MPAVGPFLSPALIENLPKSDPNVGANRVALAFLTVVTLHRDAPTADFDVLNVNFHLCQKNARFPSLERTNLDGGLER